MYAASPWSCWVREWGGFTEFINNPPVVRFMLGLRYGRVLGFLGFLGVSAPSVNDLTGGADHPEDGVLGARGFKNASPLHRLIFRGMG